LLSRGFTRPSDRAGMRIFGPEVTALALVAAVEAASPMRGEGDDGERRPRLATEAARRRRRANRPARDYRVLLYPVYERVTSRRGRRRWQHSPRGGGASGARERAEGRIVVTVLCRLDFILR